MSHTIQYIDTYHTNHNVLFESLILMKRQLEHVFYDLALHMWRREPNQKLAEDAPTPAAYLFFPYMWRKKLLFTYFLRYTFQQTDYSFSTLFFYLI